MTTNRAINRDAAEMAAALSRQIGIAVNQGIEDAASLRDAKLRRIVEKTFGAEVADGLAGTALKALAAQCEQKPTAAGAGDAIAANFNKHRVDDLIPDISLLPKE